MSQSSDNKVGKSGDAEMQDADDDNSIDIQLRQLGEAFLEKETPKALLDVLRQAVDARPSGELSPDDASQKPDRDPARDDRGETENS